MSEVATVETPKTMLTDDEKKAKRQAYNRSYYDTHKDDLRTKKRDRYNNDEEYRERVKQDSKARRKSATGTNGAVLVEVLKVMVEAFQPRRLAEGCNRSISTINYWQTHNTIPETPFRTPGGYRLYTQAMIDGVVLALTQVPKPKKGEDAFRTVVVNAWRRAGVPV